MLGFNKDKRPDGFTIAELLIATGIFSIVLLGALAGFTQMGRLFYKGVSLTQTQAVSQQVLSDMRDDIQNSSSVSIPTGPANGYTYYCVNGHRYTYAINKEVDINAQNLAPAGQNGGGNFGIIKDSLPGDNACAAPCQTNCTAGSVAFNNPQEMLGNKMRVEAFSLSQPDPTNKPNVYSVSLVIAYGDDQNLSYTKDNDLSTVFCEGNTAAQQFCAVSRLYTTIYRGIKVG